MKKCFLLLSLLFLIQFTLTAQTQSRTGGWFAILNSIKLSKKVTLQADFHYRTSDAWQHLQTLIIRPGITYRFNPNFWTVLGYNHLNTRTTINGFTSYLAENHLWEQFWFRHTLQKFTVTNRITFEQRFLPTPVLEGNKVKNSGFHYVNRFRYWVRFMHPFKYEKNFSKGMYGILQEELFLNFGNISFANGHSFDQSRTFGGLGFRFSPRFDLEIGYQYRRVQGKGTLAFNDNLLQATTLLRL
ncbi:MAG: DUF2490 domain-containing protein [Chitinophagaceae bacterium]|nr:DUF2490 domain-containing protein [Chitinophagaceae bacterium]